MERQKRITALADGRNRIERRYRLLDAQEQVVDEFTMDVTIRPYSPDELVALAAASGLRCLDTIWDYGAGEQHTAARFATLLLAAERGEPA